jgi:hypothetical protein
MTYKRMNREEINEIEIVIVERKSLISQRRVGKREREGE